MSLYAEYRTRYPEIIANLEHARANDRFSHAFLIRCNDPAQGREFAVVAAQICGCPHSEAGIPDPDCHFCRRLESGTYPESHLLTPQGKMFQIRVGDAENPEPNTIRRFLYDLSLTASTLYPLKLGIIHHADRMNAQAQNALLKTLEEPARDTLLLLLTANPEALLPTTRSRCQLIELPDTGRKIDFAGMKELCRILFRAAFSHGTDPAGAEQEAVELIELFGTIQAAAEERSRADFAAELEVAKNLEDPVFLKNLENRRADAASGNYMLIRNEYLAAIHAFFGQIYLLSQGVEIEDLPHPELFEELVLPTPISPEHGRKLLAEAEELLRTLRFNVNEALALRTFAISLPLAGK